MASVDDSLGTRLLPAALSVIAGSVDTISFVGLGGLFAAHITGNLVLIAAHIVAGGEAPLAHMLSVPVFIVVIGVTRLLAYGLEWAGVETLRPLLLLQFVLLAGFLAACVAAGTPIDPNASTPVLGAMLGVAAMAVQNALVQIALKGAPSTAVMTTNITRFTVDVGELVFGRDREGAAKARERARHTWPAIVGFAAGSGLGAACQAAAGLLALLLPAGLALLAIAMGSPRGGRRRALEIAPATRAPMGNAAS
jgi:uncharacterized membrane protein YoaK (UPF0700 family)